MMQRPRQVPLSFAFGERVRDDTKNKNAGLVDRPAEALKIILLAFLIMQTQRKVYCGT